MQLLQTVSIKSKLSQYCFTEIFNAEVLFREDCTTDEFIDVIVGNRIYMPCLYVSTRAPSLIQSVHS